MTTTNLELTDALVECLDNTAAALHTCLAHFGGHMPEGDRRARGIMVSNAKQLVKQARDHGRLKYNTMFDVAFTVEHDYDEPGDVPVKDLLAAMEKRLDYLKENPTEVIEAVGVNDTYSLEDSDDDSDPAA